MGLESHPLHPLHPQSPFLQLFRLMSAHDILTFIATVTSLRRKFDAASLPAAKLLFLKKKHTTALTSSSSSSTSSSSSSSSSASSLPTVRQFDGVLYRILLDRIASLATLESLTHGARSALSASTSSMNSSTAIST